MATVTGSQRNKVLVVDTVNTGQGANELYAMNQNVRTSDNVTFNNVTIAGSISGYATESYVGTQISNLVDSSPSTLNTLNELAAALGDDPNFATTVSNSIGTKWTQDNTRISNWNTAYGWGNHASAGYTSNVGDITAVAAGSGLSGGGTSGTVTVNVGAGDGIDTTVNTVAVDSTVIRTTGNQTLGGIKTFSSEIVATGGNSGNWNTAYGWGNHASGGYSTLTSNETVSGFKTFTHSSGIKYNGTAASPLWLNRSSGTNVNIRLSSSSSGTTYVGQGASAGTLKVGTTADLIGAGNTVWHTGTLTTTNKANYDTAYGWGNHASAGYITASNSAITNKLPLAGGTMTGQLTLSGSSPQLKFTDTTSGADDFWIHCNSDRFYVLTDRDDNGSWDGSHPLELTNSNSQGYLYGARLFAENYHPNADTLTTARTISLGGDVTGSASFNGSSNITITATVANDSHNHNHSDGNFTVNGVLQAGAGSNHISTSAAPFRWQRSGSGQTGQDDNVSVHVDDSNIYFTHNNDADGDASGYNFRYMTGGTATNLLNFSSSTMTYKGQTVFHTGYHPNADKWTTARTITLGGDLTGNVSIDGSANVTLTATVADGSGSGLDADLLDGQHGSYYYAASNPNGYTSNVGDITAVAAGSGLSGGGTSGTVTVNVGAGDGIDTTVNTVAVDSTVIRTTGNQTLGGIKTFSSEIVATGGNSGNWNTAYGWGDHASAGYTSNVGDITAVVAGSGLSGGGTSGTVTVNVGAGDGIDTTVNTVAVDSTVIRTTGNQTLGGTTQFDDMVTLKSNAWNPGVYDQIVSFQARTSSTTWAEAARIATIGAGNSPSRTIIGQGNAGLTFFDGFGSRYVQPANADTGLTTNGVCDLGSYSARWKLGRFSSGTTTSSDRNEKRDIEELTAAELRVAVRCKPLLRKYRRIDAYEEKGEAARIHFGIIAQDLDDAFTAEGLDAHRYAMFMEDTWYEYEGGVVSYPTLEDIPEEHRASATEHTAHGCQIRTITRIYDCRLIIRKGAAIAPFLFTLLLLYTLQVFLAHLAAFE